MSNYFSGMGKSWEIIAIIGILITGVVKAGAPLQICQEHRNAILYELPSPLNCTENKYEAWEVQLEKLNLKEYTSEAQALKIIKRTCTTEFSFWGTKSVLEQKTEKISVSQPLAHTLIHQGSCIDNTGDITNNNGNDQFRCDYNWPKKTTREKYDCYHYTGKLVATHNGQLRSDLADMTECDYRKKYCETISGVHVEWETIKEQQNEYIAVGQFNGTKIEDRLLIPELGMAFKIEDLNDQKDNTIIYDREFRITILKRGHLEQEIQLKETDEIEVLKDEIDSKFSYLVNMVESPHFKAKMLCDIYNNLARMEQVVASADPTSYIRYKTNNQLQIARKLGNFVLAFPCLLVKSFSWSTNNSKCYQDIAINYQLEGTNKDFKGYVHHKYNYIIPESIEVDCHKRGAMYTDINGEFKIHNGQGKISKINITHSETLNYNLDQGVGYLDFLDTSWAYRKGELMHIDVDRQVLQELDKKTSQFQVEDSTSTLPNIWKYLGIWGKNPVHIISAIVMWIERVIIIVVFYLVIGRKLGRKCIKKIRKEENDNPEV